LFRKRTVQAELAAQTGDFLLAGIHRRHQRRRIADHVAEDEDHQSDQEENEQAIAQPREQKNRERRMIQEIDPAIIG
jgi:hypothetical protein